MRISLFRRISQLVSLKEPEAKLNPQSRSDGNYAEEDFVATDSSGFSQPVSSRPEASIITTILGATNAARSSARTSVRGGSGENEATIQAIPADNYANNPQMALANLLAAVQTFLPTTAAPLPKTSVSVVKVIERPLGVGNKVGVEYVGDIPLVEIRGGRLEATLRFQLWDAEPNGLDTVVQTLQQDILQSRADLMRAGFLKINSSDTSSVNFHQDFSGWGRTADFDVLYEYRYRFVEDVLSLIVRIPIEPLLDGVILPRPETTTVRGDLEMWCAQVGCTAPNCIPTLEIRSAPKNQAYVSGLMLLAYLPFTIPGPVRVTVQDSSMALVTYPNWTDFLQAVTKLDDPDRNATVLFNTFTDFLNVFTKDGAPIALGDRDGDGLLDMYQAYVLQFPNTLHLAKQTVTLEVRYEAQNLPHQPVVYVRADVRRMS